LFVLYGIPEILDRQGFAAEALAIPAVDMAKDHRLGVGEEL